MAMQRWIVLGIVAMALMSGGGAFAYRIYKQNRPQPVWVPLSINPELPGSKRDAAVKELKTKLDTPEIMLEVSKDLGLAQAWDLPTESAAAAELSRRLFIRLGEIQANFGTTPTVDIGVNGTVKEKALSEKIAMRLMKDVEKILGLKPPPRKEP